VPFRAAPSPFAANCGDIEGFIAQASLFAETIWSDAGVWMVVQALAVSPSPAREGSAPGVLAPSAHPSSPAPSPALEAYEALAPFYDVYTAGYAHDRWLGELEGLARRCGLRGRRVLDVACGTGKSFEPLARRGYDITACDLSPTMVAIAAAKAPEGAHVFVADMRELPAVGTFDLITCLDDSINYLLTRRDLRAALRSMGSLLAEHGLLVFDVNTLSTYRTVFAQAFDHQTDELSFRWSGECDADLRPGGLAAATVEVERAGSGPIPGGAGRHLQRHHPRRVVEDALARTGLECRAVRGQLRGARLEKAAEETRHVKFVYVAGRAPALTRSLDEGGGETPVIVGP
jgi:SAM-dependent methyltransferase